MSAENFHFQKAQVIHNIIVFSAWTGDFILSKHKNVLWVSFIAIKHKQLSFDVAPMYKVHLSDTLLKSCYCMYKVCIYDILQ